MHSEGRGSCPRWPYSRKRSSLGSFHREAQGRRENEAIPKLFFPLSYPSTPSSSQSFVSFWSRSPPMHLTSWVCLMIWICSGKYPPAFRWSFWLSLCQTTDPKAVECLSSLDPWALRNTKSSGCYLPLSFSFSCSSSDPRSRRIIIGGRCWSPFLAAAWSFSDEGLQIWAPRAWLILPASWWSMDRMLQWIIRMF